jgi:hypothetical protein
MPMRHCLGRVTPMRHCLGRVTPMRHCLERVTPTTLTTFKTKEFQDGRRRIQSPRPLLATTTKKVFRTKNRVFSNKNVRTFSQISRFECVRDAPALRRLQAGHNVIKINQKKNNLIFSDPSTNMLLKFKWPQQANSTTVCKQYCMYMLPKRQITHAKVLQTVMAGKRKNTIRLNYLLYNKY